jgi:cation diffusion facilitator family transporter
VLFGLTVAAKPADAEHPYGHGRVETLSGLLIGLVLTAGGALICYGSLDRIGRSGQPVSQFVIWPLVISFLAKATLSSVKFRYGHKLKSSALTADAWNDAMDTLSATTALVAVGLALWNAQRFRDADAYGGFLVGLIVIAAGVRVAHETATYLMDTMPDERLMNQIRAVAATVPGAAGVEKCFARKTGLQYHVDLHLEVDPDMTVRQSHEIAHNVRQKILDSLDWVADVLVHVEPAS